MAQMHNLSVEAQKIIELVGEKGGVRQEGVDIAAILQAHPYLIKGLNEYTQWRAAQFAMVSKEQMATPITHGTSQALEGLRRPKE